MKRTDKKEHKAVKETAMYKVTGMRFQLLLFNAIPLILVEAFYTALSLGIIAPLFRFIFNAIIKISGIGALTSENCLQFLLNPLTLVSTIFLLIAIGIYSLLDISAAIFTFDCSRLHKRVGVIEIAEFSLKSAKRIIQPKNILIIIVALVLLPIMNLGVSSGFLSSLTIPTFIFDFIRSNTALIPIAAIAAVAMIVFSLRWAFALHFFIIEHVDFTTAIKKSARLARKHRILNLVSMFVVQTALGISNFLLINAGKLVMFSLIGVVDAQSFMGAFLLAVVFGIFSLAISVLNLLGMPISVLKISARYYYLKDTAEEDIAPIPFNQRKLKNA